MAGRAFLTAQAARGNECANCILCMEACCEACDECNKGYRQAGKKEDHSDPTNGPITHVPPVMCDAKDLEILNRLEPDERQLIVEQASKLLELRLGENGTKRRSARLAQKNPL